MCLILLGWRAHPTLTLAVAANRDEFHGRKAAPAAFWEDRPGILAGRDLEAMGTWMGVSRAGRFAAVTNYRGAREASAQESRGALVTRFLEGSEAPAPYFSDLSLRKDKYSGFNLLASDGEELWWMSNRGGAPRRLEPGIYGLGNLLLDSPEVEPDKARFRTVLGAAAGIEPLFGTLSPARIVNPAYGTRCSTVFLRSRDGRVRYAERTYSPDGTEGETLRFEFG
ncbi:MAG TPA: NRDE family protein [Burkholderiales bacterium]|nr:NRDE family protein [Burkholderiales bacterium]